VDEKIAQCEKELARALADARGSFGFGVGRYLLSGRQAARVDIAG